MTKVVSNVTRRETLAGIAITSLASTATASLPVTTRAKWDSLMADLERADREAEQLIRVANLARDRFDALKPSLAMVDVHNLPNPFADEQYVTHTMNVDRAREQVKSLSNDQARRRILAAIDTVEDYRNQLEHTRKITKLDAHNDASDDACDRVADCYSRLIQCPAPDAAAVMWKVEYAFADGGGYTPEYVAPILADLRRFLGAAQ